MSYISMQKNPLQAHRLTKTAAGSRSFLFFLFVIVGPALLLCLVGCAAIPVRDYPRLILGKWEIRTYGHYYRPDGTVVIFNPDNSEIMEKGTWSLAGDKLSMNWEERERPLRQKVRIKFISPDSWEWYSTKGRVWDATRMDAAAPSP